MAKSFEELQIKDDFMFGIIMRNPKFCKPFLERVLGVKISRIEYPKSQEVINLSADAKSVRLDIYVEDDNNAVYNIEMQAAMDRCLPKRTRYYQGMIDLNILEKGESYKALKRSFVIFVCTFDLFGDGRHIYTFENRCIQDPDLALGDDTVKVILNTKGILDDIDPKMKKLLNYVDGREPEDDFTRELDAAVESARKNEKWRLDYMTLQMHYQEKYEEGREEGRQEGRQEGIENEKEKTVRRLMKVGNFSVEEISVLTELPIEKVKEIAELQLV